MREETPVLGCVSRLLPRKGFELLVEVLPEFLEQGAELVVCGNGKRDVKEALQQLEARFPEQVAVISYSEASAAEVLSSIDLFLMPSLIEPCGTAQLQAMRYGAVPLVRATGGLKDTVKPYDQDHPTAGALCSRTILPRPSRGADGRADGLSGRRDLGDLGEALHDPGLLLDAAG